MINLHRRIVLTTLKVADLTVVAGALVLAVCFAVGHPGDWLSILELRIKLANVVFLFVYLGYWHILFRSFGLYQSHRLAPSSREWQNILVAVLVGAAPLIFLYRVFEFTYVTVEFLAAFMALAVTGLGVERRLLRAVARGMRRQGRNLRNAIIVGNGDAAFDMAARLTRRADLGYNVAALIDTATLLLGSPVSPRGRGASDGHGTPASADPTEATMRRVAAISNAQAIDEVFVTLPLDTSQPTIRAIVLFCEERGITVRLLSAVGEPLFARAQVDEIDNRPVITLFSGPPDSPALLVKRLFDFWTSLLLLCALSPLLLVLAILIKLDSRGPVLFSQERVGLSGRRFRALKFRTMVADAEQQQAALEPRNEAQGPIFKIRHDPRVTAMGAFLRRSSLDELPQLVNVLRGEMSLVGPRPLPVRDAMRIDTAAHKRRFSVKPGITCLWQINGREPYFNEWIKADMEYIDRWSLLLDFEILLKTIPAVLSRRGAY